MSNEMIAVRLTSEQKERLEQLASQRNQTISDVIRAWIDGNDSGMNGISPDLLHAISIEAQRRGISTKDLIARLVSSAFGKLRKNTSATLFILD